MDEHYKDYIDDPWQLHVRNEVYNVHVGFGRDVFKDDDEEIYMKLLRLTKRKTERRKITFDIAYSAVTGSADITAAE